KKCHSDVKIRAGPNTSIPTIDPAFTQYRDPGGGSSTSHSSPMHSPHEEQGDDDDHAEQSIGSYAGSETYPSTFFNPTDYQTTGGYQNNNEWITQTRKKKDAQKKSFTGHTFDINNSITTSHPPSKLNISAFSRKVFDKIPHDPFREVESKSKSEISSMKKREPNEIHTESSFLDVSVEPDFVNFGPTIKLSPPASTPPVSYTHTIIDPFDADSEVTENTQSEESLKESEDVSSDEIVKQEESLMILLLSIAFVSISVTKSLGIDHDVFGEFYEAYKLSELLEFAKPNFDQLS
ncbi:hypothetical protein RYX36_000392, partial [Vicia faba]